MLLAVEVANERVSRQDFEVPLYIWDFPATIFPSTKSSGKNSGLVYDLIGYGLTNLHGDHFTARYASHDKKTIYTYDGMKNDGFSIKESNATFNSHMVGNNINIPSGFVVYEAFYILRGGLKAQELFYSIRTKALTKKFGLHFSQSNLDKLTSVVYKSPGLVQMATNDRFWTLGESSTLLARTLTHRSRPYNLDTRGVVRTSKIWRKGRKDKQLMKCRSLPSVIGPTSVRGGHGIRSKVCKLPMIDESYG
jgi:hypothetical protein